MSYAERALLNRLFIQHGYVLNFSNQEFKEFFRDDVDVDIYDQKYALEGDSKGKRLRAFLAIEDNATVARAVRALWEYRKMMPDRVGVADPDEAAVIALIGKLSPTPATPPRPAPVKAPHVAVPIDERPAEVEYARRALASYADTPDAHPEKVLAIVQRLRGDGIDCYSAHFEAFPKQGWRRWMDDQLASRKWVLIFASEDYKRRAEGQEEPGLGLGVIWEHGAIARELYEAGRINERFIPVGFGNQRANVPRELREYQYFDLDSDVDYAKLLCVLNGERFIEPRPVADTKSPETTTRMNSDVIGEPVSTPKSEAPRQITTVFFSDRFTQAFPGVRGTDTFKPPIANDRLAILLKPPLQVRYDDGSYNEPIWIWRAQGELGIRRFEIRDDGSVLLNVEELDIDKIVAFNRGIYYQQFVYVQTRPSTPTGLYDYSDLHEAVERFGAATEEFGIYEGRYITRAEFDDGAAVIDGKPIDVRDGAQLRVRFLTPANFILAAQGSPINDTAFDGRRKDLLRGILRGDHTVDDLVAAIEDLPKPRPLRGEPGG